MLKGNGQGGVFASKRHKCEVAPTIQYNSRLFHLM